MQHPTSTWVGCLARLKDVPGGAARTMLFERAGLASGHNLEPGNLQALAHLTQSEPNRAAFVVQSLANRIRDPRTVNAWNRSAPQAQARQRGGPARAQRALSARPSRAPAGWSGHLEWCSRDRVLAEVSEWSGALRYASDAHRADREIVLAAVSNEGWALQYAAKDLHADHTVVLAAVANDDRALQFAARELCADRDFVIAAVSKSGVALQYADVEFRADHEIVMRAVEKDGLAIDHCLLVDRSGGVHFATSLDLIAVSEAATQQNPKALRGLPAMAREQIAAAYRGAHRRAGELTDENARLRRRLEGTVVTALNVETGEEELVELAPLSTTARAAAPPPRSALRVEADHTAHVGAIKEERDDQTDERGHAYQFIELQKIKLEALKLELAERGATINRLEAETRSLRSEVTELRSDNAELRSIATAFEAPSAASRRPAGPSAAAPNAKRARAARRSAAPP